MNRMMLIIIKQCQPPAAVMHQCMAKVARAMIVACYFNTLTECSKMTFHADHENSAQRY